MGKAYTKKKKTHIETPAERAWIEEKLNASRRWVKPYKGEIVYECIGCSQQFVRRARYSTYEELEADAKSIVESMKKLDRSREWKIVSAKIVGQTVDDEAKD